jgi:hypothetical protein
MSTVSVTRRVGWTVHAATGVIVMIVGFTCAAACGRSRPVTIPTSGEITCDNQPLADAEVVFTPAGGRPASGRTDERGRFSLTTFSIGDGAMPGEHIVTVSKQVAKDAAGTGPYLEYVQLVAPHYANPQSSPLRATVSPEGPKSHAFAIEGNAARPR